MSITNNLTKKSNFSNIFCLLGKTRFSFIMLRNPLLRCHMSSFITGGRGVSNFIRANSMRHELAAFRLGHRFLDICHGRTLSIQMGESPLLVHREPLEPRHGGLQFAYPPREVVAFQVGRRVADPAEKFLRHGGHAVDQVGAALLTQDPLECLGAGDRRRPDLQAASTPAL
jgi:hypothetical protein